MIMRATALIAVQGQRLSCTDPHVSVRNTPLGIAQITDTLMPPGLRAVFWAPAPATAHAEGGSEHKP